MLWLFSGTSNVTTILSSSLLISNNTSNPFDFWEDDFIADVDCTPGELVDCGAECERFTSPINETLYSKVCIVSIILKVKFVDGDLFVCVYQLEVVVLSYSDLGTILIISCR